jgi:hypothetical protein
MKSIYDKNVKSGAHGMRDPNDVIIVGLDTEDGPEHPLCDITSNNTPISEAGVLYAYQHGISDMCTAVRDGDKILIQKGRKRTRELREANLRRIRDGLDPWRLPVFMAKGAYDAPGMRRSRIMENWLRRNIDPVTKSREAQELIDHGEMTEEDLCIQLEIKKPQLKNILALQSLSAPVLAEITSGRLTPTAAAPLIKLSVADQKSKLAEILAPGAKKPTVRAVRAATSGKSDAPTPKMRLRRATEILQSIAADLAAILGDEDDDLIGSLSQLSDALCGKSWSEMTSPVVDDSTSDDENELFSL